MRSDMVVLSLRISIAATLTTVVWLAIPAAASSVRTGLRPQILTTRPQATSAERGRSLLSISSHFLLAQGLAANIAVKAPTQPRSQSVPVSKPIAPDPRLQTDPPAGLQATIEPFLPPDPVERLMYEKAASRFPSFCQNWQRLLHDRELNNLRHLKWQKKNGYETATYVGYGKVQSCECKASEGLPIGKIRYPEVDYYLVGKTVRQALRATPKVFGETNTLEIFSWQKNKWFY